MNACILAGDGAGDGASQQGSIASAMSSDTELAGQGVSNASHVGISDTQEQAVSASSSEAGDSNGEMDEDDMLARMVQSATLADTDAHVQAASPPESDAEDSGAGMDEDDMLARMIYSANLATTQRVSKVRHLSCMLYMHRLWVTNEDLLQAELAASC